MDFVNGVHFIRMRLSWGQSLSETHDAAMKYGMNEEDFFLWYKAALVLGTY